MTTPPPEDGWPAPDDPTRVAPAAPPPPVPPPVESPADRRIGAGMLLALGAIALVALGFLITYLLIHRHHHHPVQTTTPPATLPTTTVAPATGVVVPDVRKVKIAQATSILESLGLKVRTTNGGTKPGQAAGTVISESPQTGAKVARGSEVLLVVASGNGAGTPTTTASTTTAASTTTQQTTTAQTTTAQATTPSSATVPDLSGQNEASAATALGQAGLLASLVFVPSTDELGTVEGQGKSAGTTVRYHDHVQVNVSTGPGQKPLELVPNVIGKTLKDGLAAINGAHLRLIYLKYPVTSKAQAGKIVQQTPLGRSRAPQNAQVIVYLASYQS